MLMRLVFVFVWMTDVIFTIDLISSQVEKVGKVSFAFGVVPFTSFYTPGAGLVLSLLISYFVIG
jgi:hypothetical protein